MANRTLLLGGISAAGLLPLLLTARPAEAAKVVFSVVEHKRGPKLINFKKRRRKGYERRVGHRQELTVVKVESIA